VIFRTIYAQKKVRISEKIPGLVEGICFGK